MTAAVILGHGSRSPAAVGEVYELARQVEAAGLYSPVEVAFMSMNQPDLGRGIEAAVAKGARRIVVVPLFLTEGVHVREDIPQLVAREAGNHPGVEILCARNIGPDRRLAEILLDRIREVCPQ